LPELCTRKILLPLGWNVDSDAFGKQALTIDPISCSKAHHPGVVLCLALANGVVGRDFREFQERRFINVTN
jgi:hypothetical protein